MKMTLTHTLGALVAALALATLPCRAQETPPPAPEAAAAPSTDVVLDLMQTPMSELEVLLMPLAGEDLSVMADEAMARLRGISEELSRALVLQRRARASHDTTPEQQADIDALAQDLFEQKTELTSRFELVLDAWKNKGGDVAAAKAYVAVVQGLAPEQMAAPESSEQPTEEEDRKAQLTKSVGNAIESVRAEPPGHESPQPWLVPIAELELELQPLRVAEVEERVNKWIELLQREVRRRIRIDIALARNEESDQQSELARRSASQQEIVQAVVARTEAALRILQKRGGDITEYSRYIATATGQKLNLTDPGVLYAQAIAWMKSSDGGMKLGLNIVKFLGLLLVFYMLSRILGRAVRTAISRLPKASSLLKTFLVGTTQRVTLLIGLVIAVSALGVNVTPLVAAIGAAGLVIGLALQGTLSNFASGILILFYRPYDVGDFINGGGVSGKVESMNLVSTSILTPDNQVLIVPNNQVWNGVITNVTGRRTRRVDLVFGIGYGDDIAQAVAVLEETMSSHAKVLSDPAPVVKVHELGDNSVNLIARPWVNTTDYWDVYWDLMRTVKECFDAAGLNIPYPQRDLHIPGTIEVKLTGDRRRETSKSGVLIETQSTTAPAAHTATEAAPTGTPDDGDRNEE
ncbi:MAG: mechanosensitive ion channel family protein [Planctomycetota bacterium]|jgi:small conductance mechanosensitive channel